VGAEIGSGEDGEALRIELRRALSSLVLRLERGSEELDSLVGLAPRLIRVVGGDRGRVVRAEVARVLRAWLGQPDDLELSAPGEVGGVEMGAVVGGDRCDRAECRAVEQAPSSRRDPRRGYGTV